jgi:hypothetical protein
MTPTRFGALLLCLALAGCVGTRTPNLARSSVNDPDATTPQQYPQNNSGFLGYHDDRAWLTPDGKSEVGGAAIQGVVFGVITPAKRAEYNVLIYQHAVRFFAQYAVALHADDGLAPWADAYGNALWRMDTAHVTYLGWLEKYRRNPNQFPVDSLLQKAGL